MALKFKQHDNTFLIEGSINSNTVKQFKNHLEFLMLYTKALIINLDTVESIDLNGTKVLKELYLKSLTINKKFSIIGQGSKDILNDFENINVV